MKWQGVIPAIMTPFRDDLSVDAELLRHEVDAIMKAGCTGVVALGSLGEGGSLSFDEKKAVLRLCREALEDRGPLVAGIAAMTTADAVRLAELGVETGCDGLMVLPPYVYQGDWRETRTHFEAVIGATDLSCMLYNNPVAYGTDVLPEQLEELAGTLPNLAAVKESSTDVRRITAIRALLGDRLTVLVGVDDLILEGIQAGAEGWIAGLADALPEESVRLFDLARAGRLDEARALYDWFLPLLRLDTVPKFVQLIKLVQAETGLGSEPVRPPRLPLVGAEREEVLSPRPRGPGPTTLTRLRGGTPRQSPPSAVAPPRRLHGRNALDPRLTAVEGAVLAPLPRVPADVVEHVSIDVVASRPVAALAPDHHHGLADPLRLEVGPLQRSRGKPAVVPLPRLGIERADVRAAEHLAVRPRALPVVLDRPPPKNPVTLPPPPALEEAAAIGLHRPRAAIPGPDQEGEL